MEATLTKPKQSYVFDHKLTAQTLYEDEHDISETFYSLDDLFAEWDKLWEAANPGEHR